jgi:beta-fructofuranosidase
MNNRSTKILENLREINSKVKKDPQRPVYHFLPPAYWMNDPNGPIFYNGKYHLFYQFNPVDDTWGNIHWGHATSKDLVYWEHLPIALKPSNERSETHCFSGDCIINEEGTPIIIYTSIGPDKLPKDGAEQWIAIGNETMTKFTKKNENPVMTLAIHKDLEVKDWRDPFLWKEGDYWYAVLGGHLVSPTRPVLLLYRSKNLYEWEFLHPLIIGSKKRGRNWECPNFFNLGKRHMLVVSPHSRVIYSIGKYENEKFIPDTWNILDYGKCYYATNMLEDEKKERLILLGWIKGGGDISGWNGCLSLPRVLSLDVNEELVIEPLPELKRLRNQHYQLTNQSIKNIQPLFPKDNYVSTIEIKGEIDIGTSNKFGINLNSQEKINKGYSFGYDINEKRFWAGKEKAKIDLLTDSNIIKLHLFIDHSVFEIYLNNKFCISSRIFLRNKNGFNPNIFSDTGEIEIQKLDLWTLEPIW